MDIVVANGFMMERCTFFSREYHCCVLHNTRCKCEDYNPRNSKPITNADRIRSMTDEKLAEFCFRITDDVASYYGGDGYEPKYPVASKGWLDWLKKEGEEGE